MRAKRRSGITMIEIMVTAAVMAVLAVLTIPNLGAWSGDQRLKGAARSVADAFQLARAEAIRTGNRHLVVANWSLPGAAAPVVVVDDGPPATANCTIDAGEVRHEATAENGVFFGTSAANAGTTAAPDDPGQQPANIPAGSGPPDGTSFTEVDLVTSAAWVLFEPDGMPRLFTPNLGTSSCTAVGRAARGGGSLYVSNGRRDYAIVLSALGTTRVHAWDGTGWTP